jgi:hypothetical protein
LTLLVGLLVSLLVGFSTAAVGSRLLPDELIRSLNMPVWNLPERVFTRV